MTNQSEARLVARSAMDVEVVIDLKDRPITLGRESFNDVIVVEPTVSRVHALVVGTPLGHVVRDLDTTNGTFVNGAKIGSGGHRLIAGDSIGLADSTVSIEFQGTQVGAKQRAAPTAPLNLDPSVDNNLVNGGNGDQGELLNLVALALAHHVKNAVTPILGWAELIEKGRAEAELSLTEVAIRNGHKIVAIVDALIEIVETGDLSAVDTTGPGSRKMLDIQSSIDRILEKEKD